MFRDQRLYRLVLAVCAVMTVVSWGLTTANYLAAREAMRSGPAASRAAPNYPERTYRPAPDGKPTKEISVLGIEFLHRGFLSSRAATAMLVGSVFWPLVLLGYRGDYLARQREATA